jgi:hypothetical protein
MMKHIARSALLGLALFALGCGMAVDALIDEINEAIEDDDNNNNTLVVAGTGLFAIDLATGNRDVISDDNAGSGTLLLNPRALAFDEGRSRCLVWDEDRAAVIAVDVLTGDRELLSSATKGSGPSLTSVRALAFDAIGDRVIAADLGPTGALLITVDSVSGDRAILSGAGPELELPRSIIVDGGSAIVGDVSLRAIVAVDLATGDRDILADSSHGQGPLFVSPNALALMGNSLLVLDASLKTLYSVDLTDGDRVVVSGGGVGAGVVFASPAGLAFDPSGWLALVSQQTPSQAMLLDAEPLTGDRGIVSAVVLGSGPTLAYPIAIVLDGDRSRVLALNRATP